jgi:hypothetical protein
MLKLHQLALEKSLNQENWVASLTHCRAIVEIYSVIYLQRNWPLTGLQLLMLAKLEKLLFKLSDAKLHIIKAIEILRLSHGKTATIVRTAEEMHQEIELELFTNNFPERKLY